MSNLDVLFERVLNTYDISNEYSLSIGMKGDGVFRLHDPKLQGDEYPDLYDNIDLDEVDEIIIRCRLNDNIKNRDGLESLYLFQAVKKCNEILIAFFIKHNINDPEDFTRPTFVPPNLGGKNTLQMEDGSLEIRLYCQKIKQLSNGDILKRISKATCLNKENKELKLQIEKLNKKIQLLKKKR